MFRINMKNSVDCQACRDAVMKTVEDHDVFRYRFAELDGTYISIQTEKGRSHSNIWMSRRPGRKKM